MLLNPEIVFGNVHMKIVNKSINQGVITLFINQLNKIAVALALIIAAPLAMANDDCVKPKIKGYSADEMNCMGEGLVSLWTDKGSMVFDKNGKTILPTNRYEYVFQATNGLIGVGQTVGADFRVGFISQTTGKEVIPLNYVSTGLYDIGINSFSEGLVLMQKPDETWGYLNNQGKTVIPFIYSKAEEFSEGLAAVGKGEYDSSKHGFIDKTGKTIIPFVYDNAISFSEGLAAVRKGDYDTGKYGIIDKQGKIVVPFKYNGYVAPFSEGLAAVINKDDEYGFIDRAGKLVIPYSYIIESYEGNLPAFENGRAAVMDTQNNYYCINKKGTKITC